MTTAINDFSYNYIRNHLSVVTAMFQHPVTRPMHGGAVMAKIISGVYAIRNTVNGHCYIGSSIDIRGRWDIHRHHLRHGTNPAQHLQRSWNKYGEENFEFIVLQRVAERDMLIVVEQKFMDEYQPIFNSRKIAESNYGMRSSDETRAKIAASKKNKRPVIQYTLSGEFVAEFESVSVGAKSTGQHVASIIKSCNGNHRSRKSIWRYIGSDIPVIYSKPNGAHPSNFKPVIQFARNGDFVAEYESAIAAHRATKIEHTNILHCAFGRRKTAGGFIWQFVNNNKGE